MSLRNDQNFGNFSRGAVVYRQLGAVAYNQPPVNQIEALEVLVTINNTRWCDFGIACGKMEKN